MCIRDRPRGGGECKGIIEDRIGVLLLLQLEAAVVIQGPLLRQQRVCGDVYKRQALDLKPGDKTFVMINGCGATTMMEMLVLFKDTVEFLKAKGVEVVASMVGEILTVQEAGGFQMNIAKWDDECIRLWNTPCHTPAYSRE